MTGSEKIHPNNLTSPAARLFAAPRCHAKAKRTGQQCRVAAVRGFKVCRVHGARGGAPKGNRNAWKHGEFSEQAQSRRRAVGALMKLLRHQL
jgi:hypothetical protein